MNSDLEEIIRVLALHGFALETKAAARLYAAYEAQNPSDAREFLAPIVEQLYQQPPPFTIVTERTLDKLGLFTT